MIKTICLEDHKKEEPCLLEIKLTIDYADIALRITTNNFVVTFIAMLLFIGNNKPEDILIIGFSSMMAYVLWCSIFFWHEIQFEKRRTFRFYQTYFSYVPERPFALFNLFQPKAVIIPYHQVLSVKTEEKKDGKNVVVSRFLIIDTETAIIRELCPNAYLRAREIKDLVEASDAVQLKA